MLDNYLVHYLRYWNRVPFGCIVATSPDNIGISICSPKDKFNKKRAINIAYGRSLIRNDSVDIVPNRIVDGYYGDSEYYLPCPMKKYVEDSISIVKKRAKKYFKVNEEQREI